MNHSGNKFHAARKFSERCCTSISLFPVCLVEFDLMVLRLVPTTTEGSPYLLAPKSIDFQL